MAESLEHATPVRRWGWLLALIGVAFGTAFASCGLGCCCFLCSIHTLLRVLGLSSKVGSSKETFIPPSDLVCLPCAGFSADLGLALVLSA